MESQKNKLWIKLELLIHRLQDKPSIMHDLKLDYEGGMDIKEINQLSDRDIFRVEEENGETFLVISHPNLPDELVERWCVRSQPGGWNSVNDHPRFNPDKLQRTISHLRAWQAESTQEEITERVSTGQPTAGKGDGRVENRQQILELAQEIRELAEDGRNIPNKFHGAGLRVEEIIHLGLFHENVFFRLKEFAKPDRYSNSRTPYARASIEVIDWIRDHPKSFPFDLPTFYMGDCYYRTDSGIRIASYMRDYWKTNIPALAEVIKLQCEAELAESVGQSTGTPDKKTNGQRDTAEDHQKKKPKKRKLTVSIEKQSATLNGVEYDLKSPQVARWLKVLNDHEGEWISGPQLKNYDSELDEARTDRLKRNLPKEIRSLIDSTPQRGSRLKLT